MKKASQKNGIGALRPEREGGRDDRPEAQARGGALGFGRIRAARFASHFGSKNLRARNSQYRAAPWKFTNRSGVPE
jgi:hypothetical protein